MVRRQFLGLAAGGILISTASAADSDKKTSMYGLIGKITAVNGKRDELIGLIAEGISEMPGCLSYIIAKDPSNAADIWITEVWDSEASHKASLKLPAVRKMINAAKPLIAGFGDTNTTQPVVGHGLVMKKASK